MMYNSTITGMGFFVPENVVTNDDLTKLMDTSDEWIQERTGVNKKFFWRARNFSRMAPNESVRNNQDTSI